MSTINTVEINIEIEGYGQVTMRPPKVRDSLAVAKYTTPEEKEFNLVANLTGIAPAELEEFSLKQYHQLAQGLASFLS